MAALTIQTYCIVWWLRYVCGEYASHNFLPGAPGAWMNHHVTTGLPNSKQCITAVLRQGYSTSPNPISHWGLGRKNIPTDTSPTRRRHTGSRFRSIGPINMVLVWVSGIANGPNAKISSAFTDPPLYTIL